MRRVGHIVDLWSSGVQELMPFSLALARQLALSGWKVKIRDRERVEPPHVSIMRGMRCWRLSLRTMVFLDREPDPSEVPRDIVDEVIRQRPALCAAWDRMYPHNPVASKEDGDE